MQENIQIKLLNKCISKSSLIFPSSSTICSINNKPGSQYVPDNQFEKIYCNFEHLTRKYYQETKKLSSSSSINEYPTNNHLKNIKHESSLKNIKAITPSKSVINKQSKEVNAVNKYGIHLTKKTEKQKQVEEHQRKRNRTPQYSTAKKKEPNLKINHKELSDSLLDNFCEDITVHNCVKQNDKNQRSHSSLTEPVYKNPKKKKVRDLSLTYCTNDHPSFQHKHSSNRKSPVLNMNYINRLYQKGINQYQKIQQNYHNNIEKQTNEYQLYTYKPNLSKTNKSMSSVHIVRQRKKKMIFEQQTDWQSFVGKKTAIRKGIEEVEEASICTFKPKTTIKIMKNDEAFIQKHIKYTTDYIIRKRQSLQINLSRNDQSTGLRNNSKGEVKQINQNQSSLKVKEYTDIPQFIKNKPLNSLDFIDKMRNQLNIKNFFIEESKEL